MGVPIAEVLAEAAVVIPAVASQSEADRWKDVHILDSAMVWVVLIYTINSISITEQQ